ALPDHRREGARDHPGASWLDLRARGPPFRDRRPWGRRQDPPPARVRRQTHGEGNRPAQLRRPDVPLYPATRTDPRRLTPLAPTPCRVSNSTAYLCLTMHNHTL